MKNRIYIGLILITCFIAEGCKSGMEEIPPQPFIRTKVVFAQKDIETGYNIEVYIPWSIFEITASDGLSVGFDLLLIDDDDGGLLDHKLSWATSQSSIDPPLPVNFGTLTLKEELSPNESGQVIYTPIDPIIEGKKDALWENAPAMPISKFLRGGPTESKDISGNFRAVWDSLALYLFIEVTDDTLSLDSWAQNWEDDGVAIYIDPLLSRADELVAGETHLYRILRNSETILYNDFPISPTWTLSVLDVFDGGPGIDGIPALVTPEFIAASEAKYLRDNDLVIGFVNGNEARAYPHKILDWHEIVNDEINSFEFALTYCPLTGTGIGWEREINGVTTTFGVSGLLYSSNLIPYDRLTGSNWSQMRLDCIQGPSQGQKVQTLPMVETSWKTWKSLYPDTKVLSPETGHDRNYGEYPYNDYRTNHDYLIFPIVNDDTRMPRKTRVHGIIANKKALIYPFSKFLGNSVALIHDEFQGEPIIVAGSAGLDYIVSFSRKLEDGTILSFSRINSTHPSVIMTDEEGNEWDILGRAVSGPRTGSHLSNLDAYMGYWFSFGALFPDAIIR